MNNSFAEDIIKGLSGKPKFLHSKYFYDDAGSELFQQIMNCPEYYPTKCEYEILTLNKFNFQNLFTEENNFFELIELGAGDGLKTKILLKHFLQEKINFKYIAIDISQGALNSLASSINDLPGINYEPIRDDYFHALKKLKFTDRARKVILFMGATIGNFTLSEAGNFLKDLKKSLNTNDLVVIGFDLRKHPQLILDAYNDRAGITSAFNKNLLKRINTEFDANFDLSRFDHFPIYNPLTGEAKSFLISNSNQKVHINTLNCFFEFYSGEPLFTEISKKHTIEEIEQLAADCGFKQEKHFFDCRHYFVDYVWKV